MVTRWRLATIVFGALPATWLGAMTAMGLWFGTLMLIANLMSGDVMGALASVAMLLWCGLGLYGAIALWALGLGFVNALWVRGVVAGLLAAFPLVMFFVLSGDIGLPQLAVLMPAAVGGGWLWHAHSGREAPATESELDRDLARLREKGATW